MNQYKVNYVDWKGRVTCMYVFADTEMEARAQGMVGQGVFKIINLDTIVEEDHCNLEDIDICHVEEVVK